MCIIQSQDGYWVFPGGSVVKNPPANAGDLGSIPGSGRSPGGRHGNPLQHFCLEHPMDRGSWWATVHVPDTEIQQEDKVMRIPELAFWVLG